MSQEENKTEQVVVVVEKNESTRGLRGEVGTPTASLTLKQKWHESHFELFDPEDKRNPRKRVWVRRSNTPTLKSYARALAKQGDPTAKEWLENKAGAKNQERSDINVKAAKEAGFATHTAHRKSSSGKK
jgi:hypothetical protein